MYSINICFYQGEKGAIKKLETTPIFVKKVQGKNTSPYLN